MARLNQADRRRQLTGCAITVFDEVGWADATVEAVARQADVTKAIVYRHFPSKAELWHAARIEARGRLAAAVGSPPYDATIVKILVNAAAADPAAFRVSFALPPGNAEAGQTLVDPSGTGFIDYARREICAHISDPAWAEWSARVALATVATAITAWLDVGGPDPDQAVARIEGALAAITAPSSIDG